VLGEVRPLRDEREPELDELLLAILVAVDRRDLLLERVGDLGGVSWSTDRRALPWLGKWL